MSGPTIDRANSSGDIWTPWAFVHAVEEKFGKLDWDLACTVDNMKAIRGYTYPEFNALTANWNQIRNILKGGGALLYLNPPFSNITPWAHKCAEERKLGAEILLLVPASVGANWFWNFVAPEARVYSVGRMVFDNCFDRKTGELVTTAYPKDLMLCHYDPLYSPVRCVLRRWRWQDGKVRWM